MRSNCQVLSVQDAMDYAVMAAFTMERERKPGAVVARLPENVLEALSRLTSDELAKRRVEMSDRPFRRSRRWEKAK